MMNKKYIKSPKHFLIRIKRMMVWVLILCFFSEYTVPNTVFASSDITIDSLLLNGVASTLAINPGDGFKISVNGKNNGPDAVTSVFGTISFSDNSAFTYLGNLNTYIGFSQTNSPVAVSDYSVSTGLSTQITNATRTSVNAGEKPKIAGTAAQNFTVSSTGSTYQYTVNGAITGLDATAASVTSPSAQQSIYVNVKPHVLDYYFEKADSSTTTNQIQGAQAEAINLVVKVKDYNGCTNIDGGVVTADLSPLGLASSEPLTYVSCDADGKTATFKKTGITTLAPLGDKAFSSGYFSVKDEDNNSNDPNNSYFGGEDKKIQIILTVVPPAAPTVTVGSISEAFIGGPSKTSTTIAFSGSQNGEMKVVANGDGNCASGTILRDWTGSGSYVAYSATSVTVLASTLLDGVNVLTICSRNSGGSIGSATTNITKDNLAPVLSSFTISPASVITNDSNVSYKCSEDGIYQVELGGSGTLGAGTFVGSGSATANSTVSQSILNTSLVNGTNPLSVYCIDKASNVVSSTGSINKTPPTPSMAGQIGTFIDGDIDYDGLDGRDLSLTWNTGAVAGFDYFESYRIYVLPAATAFNSAAQTYAAIVTNKNTNSWTGTTAIMRDSAGALLTSGGSYKACIAIMGTSGLLGTEACSSPAVLTADTVSHPNVLSARFTSDANLELTTDATLDTNVLNHSGSLVTYHIGVTTYTGASVTSVNGKKLNINISSLGSTSATGTSLVVATGAIRANGGGFNNMISGVNISDAQAPVISAFSKTTAAQYGSFYKGNISLNFSFSEAMSGGGDTRVAFTRTSGTADMTVHLSNLTAASDLVAGAHTKVIDLNTLGLVSGTQYQIQILGKDIAGNGVNSSTISGIGYDNNGPTTPTLVTNGLFSTLTPTLSWLACTDDGGNGSGIGKYILHIYSGNVCSAGNIQTYSAISPASVSQILTTLPTNQANYSWDLTAIDNMGNTGSTATCGAFRVDTTVPVISSQRVYNQTLSSAIYARDSDALQVTATIANTDASHIWLDATALTGDAVYNHVSCAAPTGGIFCTYSANTVTYTFLAGFAASTGNGVRQVVFSAQNISGGNDQSAIASITTDNTAPAIAGGSLQSPNGGETWSGTTKSITWNTAGITDAIGIKDIVLEYSVGGGSWNTLATVPNNGSYTWNIAALADRNDYKVRITAEDFVGHQTSLASASNFLIDKTVPAITAGTLTVPNTRNIYAGGQVLAISWNTSGINDSVSLVANPIALEYSTDTGATWVSIASNLPNSGSYNWTVPTLNVESVLVRLTARDIPGNIATITSSAASIIDSLAPAQAISYAGSGGNTVPSARKINSSGLDLSLSSIDAHLATVVYQFTNTSDNLFWNTTSIGWTSSNTWNTLCSDGQILGTNGACSNISTIIAPTIVDGKNYTLVIRSTDEAGNITTSITHNYIGDTMAPVLSVNPSGATYLSGSIVFTGSASDTGSLVSSVKVQIQKGSEFWDGVAWVATAQSLMVATSDSYANWNYVFTPPLADVDGQSYTATFTAYDNAYKINNTASLVRTVTKDVVGPTITSPVFTFSTVGIYKGNTTFIVTWDTNAITTTGAALAANPITLAYNFTGSVVTLATDLPNSGSYSFSLPIVDTTTAKMIISAVDTLGNSSSSVVSSNFTIDSIPPSVQAVQTLDQAASGKIDGLLVHFSEKVQNINSTAFSIAGSVITGWSWGGVVANQDTIVLSFAATGTTASTPTLNYTASGASDIAGNNLIVGSLAATDGAGSRFTGLEIYDQNQNGKFDQIQVHFSENLAASSTLTGWTFSSGLPGISLASANVSGNTINLVLNEGTTIDTDSVGSLLSLINTIYTDSNSNLAGGFSNQILVDKAAPIPVSSVTQDINANNKIDHIMGTFSESLTGSTTGWTIANLATGSILGSTTLSGNQIIFTVNETTLPTDSGQIPTIAYTPGTLGDIAGNTVAVITTKNVTDGIAPQVTSRTTRDLDGNGKIDAITLSFAENINDNMTGLNLSVSGYTVSGYNTTCNGSTANDNRLCVLVDEGMLPDSASTPAVQILTNTSLGDVAGNLLPIDATGVAATDAVGPVITSARYDAGAAGITDDKLYLTFSESLSGATIDVNPSLDFVLANGGSFGSNSTLVITSPTTVTITLGSDATALTPGTSEIGIIAGFITDMLGNIAPTPGSANMIVTSPTIIINEVMWSGTGSNSYQYIELRNPGTSPVNLTGWKLKNAGGNGTTLIIPSSTIGANGYYLIANSSAITGPLSVTPDYVNSSLNLSPTGQNAVVLMNGNQTIDDVVANPWPVGDNILPASMERNIAPGDGQNALNWHIASAAIGFDNGLTALGTPGSANILDGIAPTITNANILDNTLFPSGTGITLDYTYTDNVAVNPLSASFTISKWNGTSYTDVTNSSVSSSGTTGTGANYAFNALPFGKYQSVLQIADTSGNPTTKTTIFFVDQLEFSVSTGSVNIGTINPTTVTYAPDVIVTVKTLGAGFDLTLGGSGVMNAGINTLPSWSGVTGGGFGFDYSESGSGGSIPFAGTPQPINPTTLATYATGSIDANGLQKTFTYTVRYGAKIVGPQAAGNYAANTLFGVTANY